MGIQPLEQTCPATYPTYPRHLQAEWRGVLEVLLQLFGVSGISHHTIGNEFPCDGVRDVLVVYHCFERCWNILKPIQDFSYPEQCLKWQWNVVVGCTPSEVFGTLQQIQLAFYHHNTLQQSFNFQSIDLVKNWVSICFNQFQPISTWIHLALRWALDLLFGCPGRPSCGSKPLNR